jgi:hypothetical protein
MDDGGTADCLTDIQYAASFAAQPSDVVTTVTGPGEAAARGREGQCMLVVLHIEDRVPKRYSLCEIFHQQKVVGHRCAEVMHECMNPSSTWGDLAGFVIRSSCYTEQICEG